MPYQPKDGVKIRDKSKESNDFIEKSARICRMPIAYTPEIPVEENPSYQEEQSPSDV